MVLPLLLLLQEVAAVEEEGGREAGAEVSLRDQIISETLHRATAQAHCLTHPVPLINPPTSQQHLPASDKQSPTHMLHSVSWLPCAGGGGGGGGGGNMLSLRRTRRWRHSNGLVYEEETEVVHMSAGSGGNSSSRAQPLTPSSSSMGGMGGVDSSSGSNSSAGSGSVRGVDRGQLQALAAALAGDAGQTGGRMFWHRGGGGFSWSWRRRRN